MQSQPVSSKSLRDGPGAQTGASLLPGPPAWGAVGKAGFALLPDSPAA